MEIRSKIDSLLNFRIFRYLTKTIKALFCIYVYAVVIIVACSYDPLYLKRIGNTQYYISETPNKDYYTIIYKKEIGVLPDCYNVRKVYYNNDFVLIAIAKNCHNNDSLHRLRFKVLKNTHTYFHSQDSTLYYNMSDIIDKYDINANELKNCDVEIPWTIIL